MPAKSEFPRKLRQTDIEDQWDEGHPNDGGDGYWVYLKPGLKWAGDATGNVHLIHEDTKALCAKEQVMVCACEDCLKLIEASVKVEMLE